jgi:hypothetical protein
MTALDRNVGLIAGACAAVVYAACVFLIDLGLLWSALPAVAVCAAVLLLAPGGPMGKKLEPTQAEKAAMVAGRAKIKSMREMLGSLPHSAQRVIVERIVEKSGRIADAIEQDWNKFQAAQPFLVSYLEPIEGWLKRYSLVVSRGIQLSESVRLEAENETLPRMERSLDKLYQRLHVKDIAFVMGGNEVELNFPIIEARSEETGS